jgi:transcriptional repressor NrdR
MKCIFCGAEDSSVIDSRDTKEGNSIRRRRVCLKCGKRFTTYETIETSPIMVIKRDHSRQTFDRNKIIKTLTYCSKHTDITTEQINNVAFSVEQELFASESQEIESSFITDIIIKYVKDINKIVATRVAVLHKDFKDINELVRFLYTIG